MKKIYRIEVCYINRLFGLNPIIRAKSFFNKDKADVFAAKVQKNKNRFVWARYENGKEVEL